MNARKESAHAVQQQPPAYAGAKVVIEIDGEMAELVTRLAEWMRWPPGEVGAALVAAMLEAFCGDDMETVQACLNSYERYCATGRVHEEWRPWLAEEVTS